MDECRDVVRRVYALDEPWRSRFLDLIAHEACPSWNGRGEPSEKQMVTWLRDYELRLWVMALLRAWGALKDDRETGTRD